MPNLEDLYVVPTDEELALERQDDDRREAWDSMYLADNYGSGA
jgi:hypothetical protein